MRKIVITVLTLALVAGTSACGGDDDDGGSAASFCDKAREYDEKYADEEVDFSDEEAIDDFRDLANSSPSEIRDDAERVLEVFDAFIENQDDLEALAELESEFADVEQASQRVEDYLEDECGIESEEE